jgi:DNA-binding transcriptional MerR regulator
MDKSPDAFRTISEVAEALDLPQHVLRFWESRFPQIKPLKRGGGRRYYRPDDVDILRAIRQLLYGEGYTIKGVQRLFKEQGVKAVASSALSASSDAIEASPDLEPAIASAPEVAPPRAVPHVEPPRSTAPPPAENRAHESERSILDIKALQGVLADLVECARILDSARPA